MKDAITEKGRKNPGNVARPVVALCAGKDCARRCESAKMRATLEVECVIIDIACVGLCNGPVVVIDADAGRPAVYTKLRSKRQRRLVLAAARGKRRARRDLTASSVGKAKVVRRVARQTGRRLAAGTTPD